MFGIAILDVVIGMVFIYLLLSLVCSSINEIIEAFANKRAKFLEQGIKDLLNDKDGEDLSKKFYAHPLIASLIRDRHTKSLLPSYIPARNFSLALLDIVLEAGKDNKSGSAGTTPKKIAAAPLVVNVSTSETDKAAAVAPAENTDSPLDNLRQSVVLFENEYVRKALLPLIDAAGNDAAKARENIENWFNSGMDKVSGWYKRRTQYIIIAIGFLVALFLNADTIAISNQLWHDKPLRDSLVSAAQEFSKKDTSTSTTVTPLSAAAAKDCDANKMTKGICSAYCRENVNSAECRLSQLNGEMTKIESMGVPIGWSGNPLLSSPNGDLQGWLLSWLMKIFGLVITAFAVSLGAPFWFDLLNKFVVIRSTVKPREKSHEEPSKE
ncbi:MAG: hypothetical protein ABWZ66_13340 [Pyrinomonadaceae bacterium]